VYEQQKHIAVTLVLVVVMFIVCWTPLVVYAIYSTLVRDEDRIHHLANPVVSSKTVKLRSGGTPPPLFLLFPSLSSRLSRSFLSPSLFLSFPHTRAFYPSTDVRHSPSLLPLAFPSLSISPSLLLEVGLLM